MDFYVNARRYLRLSLLLLPPVLLGSCSDHPGTRAPTFDNCRWRLVELRNGNQLLWSSLAEHSPTLTLSNLSHTPHTITGHTSCNPCEGRYEISGDSLTISITSIGLAKCTVNPRLERDYLEFIDGTHRLQVTHDTLTLNNSDGSRAKFTR